VHLASSSCISAASCVTAVASIIAVACVPAVCWRPFSSRRSHCCWPPCFAGVPGGFGVSAILFVPAAAGVPAIDGGLTVASLLILTSLFYCSWYLYMCAGLPLQ